MRRWQIVLAHLYVAAPSMVSYYRRTSKKDAPEIKFEEDQTR
jgi:hypothetical protein